MSFLDDARAIFAPAPVVRPVVVPMHTGTGTGYAQRALEAEVQGVLDAAPGTRNHALNRAAFSLGQLVAGGALAERDTVDALHSAGRAAGLDEHEIGPTVASGLAAGAGSPRGVPERPEPPSLPSLAMPPADPLLATGDTDTGDDPEARAHALATWVSDRLPRVDWHALWADETEEEWIVEPILPARRLVALYSPPKVGKSLLMLELAVGVATGTEVLGTTPDRPRVVLYVDFENDPKADVRERLLAMGRAPGDLTNLVYLSFPTLAALDGPAGGIELMRAVEHYRAEVVVVDTVSRSIAGEENENDTWLNFYRHTGLRLKQAQVALIRLDHSGKDESKGQRGGSAKSGDVDAVWRMSKVTDDTFRLDCEANRMPVTEKTLVLHRESYPLRHRVDGAGRSAAFEASVADIVRRLDDGAVDPALGRDKAREALGPGAPKGRNAAWAEAVRRRRGPAFDLLGEEL